LASLPKKSVRAAEPEWPEVQRQRAVLQDTVTPRAPDDFGCLDQAGGHQAMTRLYARAPRGQRALATTPVNRGRPVTRLGALSLAGMVAAMTIEGFTDGAVFLAFLQEGPLPQPRPGQLLIMGTLRAHKVPGVAAACAAAGARLLYLPLYSPDFSSIEAC
jgi:DDE superfamily endonuclease